ncbi:MAG: hypothetical protein HWD58_13560 [Bacteroidota bacterium]|nr:MAG: hypothetical protein HWD58_13560 [Bacteroidota bacterium]
MVARGSHYIDVVFGPGNYVSPITDLYDGGAGPRVSIFDSINVNDLTGKIFTSLPGRMIILPWIRWMIFLRSVTACVTGNPASGRVYRFVPYNDPQ